MKSGNNTLSGAAMFRRLSALKSRIAFGRTPLFMF